jgi:hypothetical protein
MAFDIVWDAKAYRKLKDIWAHARPIGPAVDAFDEIERRLSQSPEEEGESRPLSCRITHVAPLGILYRVNRRLNEVHILDVWMFIRRKR